MMPASTASGTREKPIETISAMTKPKTLARWRLAAVPV
jgi:hypothetical protein